MFERLSRSWDLVKAGASVLRADKELMVFPAMSAAALMLVFGFDTDLVQGAFRAK